MPKIRDSWKEEDERRKTPLVVLPVSDLPLTNSLQIRRERKRDPSREEEMVLQGKECASVPPYLYLGLAIVVRARVVFFV